MTPSSPATHLALRSMQHILSSGWPNKKGQFRRHQRDFIIAATAFQHCEGRQMTIGDVRRFIGHPIGNQIPIIEGDDNTPLR